MSSILKKAMWPAALIAGMLVLIGTIGTATAPRAEAAMNDVCAILGPFPGPVPIANDGTKDNLLLEGATFGFIVVLEDWDDGAMEVDVSVDDEDGDVDLTSYVSDNTAGAAPVIAGSYTEVAGTDVFNNLPVYTAAELTAATAVGAAEWAANFDFDLTTLDGSECGAVVAPVADAYVLFDATCDDTGHVEITATEDTDAVPDNAVTEEYDCWGDADNMDISADPDSVESYPVRGNTAHSLITVVLTDNEGNPAFPGEQVDWSTTGCVIQGIEAADYPVDPEDYDVDGDGLGPIPHSHAGLDDDASSDSFLIDPGAPGGPLQTIAQALLHCEGADPGAVTVEAEIERPGDDLNAEVEINVVGPPAFIEMIAEPTELVCGEKAQILITVTDALGQPVSDHSRVELITNFGGVIGGTGATLTFPGTGPVNPISSSGAETFNGTATAYLLTSTTHVGAYEVVAAAGGSYLDATTAFELVDNEVLIDRSSGGVFSTEVITNQVTVTCTEGAAPEVTAPDTGTGTISPPNTGDAGLAASSSSTALLFVIAGAVAFVLAGLASFRFARR